MKEFDDKILISIKKNIETVFGKKICYSKDCTALAVEISKVTNRLISETTLKRVWNLVNSKFNPSKYTLDTLSIFLGFSDWNIYYSSNFKPKDNNVITMWDTIKRKSHLTSLYSFEAIKNRMGANYENALNRKFAQSKFEEFLESDKIATAYISPGGYGKSLLTTKIVEKYYLADNPLYPNDIVWFIDCGIIDLIDAGKFSIESFLLELLGSSPYESFIEFFKSHPEDLKGRMILIIDGLNELSSNYSVLDKVITDIIKVIEINRGNLWFKVLITCRNNIWNNFELKLKNFSDLQELWFDIDFNKDYLNFSNIPLLSDKEINKIFQLNSINTTIDKLKISDLASIEIIRIPYFLYLFIVLFRREQKISDIDLLREFVYHKISNNNNNSKIQIIYKILENLELGLNKNKTFKNKLDTILEDNKTDYNELISDGIIFEKFSETKYLQKAVSVQFTHEILFEFLLANYWLENNELSIKLLVDITEFYKNNPELKCNIITLIIKYSFKEGNIELIKNIYKFVHEHLMLPIINNVSDPCTNKIIFAIGNEIRKYPDLQKIILPIFAKDKFAVEYYYEKFCDKDFLVHFFGDSLENYISENKTLEKQTFGYYIRFIKCYFTNDLTSIHNVFENMSSLDFSLSDHLTFNYYFYCKILYQCLILGKADQQVIEYIKSVENEFIKTNNVEITEINYNLISVVDAFNMVGMHDKAIDFSIGIFRQYKLSEKAKKSRFYTYLQIFYANSLLQIGKEKDAFDIFNGINIYSDDLYTLNSKYFWLIRFLFIKVDFLMAEKKYSNVVEIYEEVLVYAKLLSFTKIEKICKSKMKEIKEKKLAD